MNNVQIYIQGNKLDLFGNEKIEVKSSIQDVRDIGTVFTDYSQTFNVPASQTNNKIFKHFYNPDVVDGYDARNKKPAEILINYIPFRRGKIMLEGVEMRNNSPYSYSVKFFGKTVSLKDLLGEDELSDLSSLRSYDHSMLEADVKTGFTDGLNENSQTNSIIYPLITPKKRLYYNSSALSSSDADGNLYKRTVDDNTRGLSYTDLKPAIKCIHLIEAIEDKYDISFTREFFDSSAFTNLYMWLHGAAEGIFDQEIETFISSTYISTNFSLTVASPDVDTSLDSNIITLNTDGISESLGTEWDVSFYIGNPSGGYTAAIIDEDTGQVVSEKSIQTGSSTTVSFRIPVNQGERRFSFQILKLINAFASITYTPTVEISLYDSSNNFVFSYLDTYTGSQNTVSFVDTRVRNNMPKIKVLDFLTGLFKMFNLTAYYVDDLDSSDYDKIKVDTLDNFYADAQNTPLGEVHDVTDYIDSDSHATNVSLPFTNVDFRYEEPKTALEENHLAQFKVAWGSSEFKPRNVDVGNRKYEVKVPFQRMKFERLHDLQNGQQTDIMCGYSAGGSFKKEDGTPPKADYQPTETAPILFYGIRETGISTPINFIENDGTPSSVTNYWRPSSTNEEGTTVTAPTYSLNFDNEIDEWNLQDYGGNTNSLFKTFYENYVTDVFEKGRRIYKFNAFLPDGFIARYRLNNKLRIGNRLFKINSITTSLTTGKSILELLNEV